MKKLSKLYWIVSAVVTIAGLSVMTVSAVQINKKNQQSQPVTASDFCKAEDLHSVEIAVSYADIQIAPAGNGQVSLTLPDDTFTYTCENGVLKIQNQQNTGFFGVQFIDFGIVQQEKKITLSLPEQQYETITLSSGTGDMNLSGISAGTLTASVGTGDINLQSCTLSGMDIDSGTGSIRLNGSEIQSVSDIDLGTGDFNAEGCTLSGIDIDSGTGNITMQDSVLLGNADIDCGTGDITMMLSGTIQDYQVDCSECIGDIRIQNDSAKSMNSVSAQYRLKADTVGDVEISFTAP